MGLAQMQGEDKYFAQAGRDQRNALFNKNAGTFDWITGEDGDPTKSPLYNSFLTKAREATTNAYDKAIMNSRANANARGFGYASPNAQGAESGIRAAQAGAISGAPATALQEVMPYQLEATGQRINEAGQFNSQANTYAQLQNEIAKQRSQNRMGLFSSLTNLAGGILGGPLGAGLTKALFPGGGGGSSGPGEWEDAGTYS